MKSFKLVTLIAIIVPNVLSAQLVADFKADTTSFCPPYVVKFSDRSYGGNITSRHWVFSPTQSSSGNNPFPTVSYAQPGLYDVTLTVSNGTQTASTTKTAYIEVFENPTADITSTGTRNGCLPLTVNFSDASSQGSAPINHWQWSFGNGQTATTANATMLYNQPGIYSATLVVRDTNGCQSSKLIPSYVNAKGKPSADFTTFNSPHHCVSPHNVQFDNKSSGNFPLTYQWKFGDGNTSTTENPAHSYHTGIFDVELMVTDRNGCKDTVFKPRYASVTATVASFSLPGTVCLGQAIPVINTSVGGSTALWNFGDGTTSTDWIPTKIYSAPGTYTITLTTSTTASCIDTYQQVVIVEKATANFTSTPKFHCNPIQVSYTDLSSSNVIKWWWKFGKNPDSSTVQNPTYNYAGAGSYDDTLIVETANGCRDTMVKVDNVIISEIIPDFIMDTAQGCAPLHITFSDRSVDQDSVASISWDFGNGRTGNKSVDTSTYTIPGTYTVKLTVTSHSGCTYQVSKKVVVGSHQTPDFVIDTTENCAGWGFSVKDKSIDSNLIDHWYWNFSDGGTGSGRAFKYIPIDTGDIDIQLVTEYNGCYDTLIKRAAFYSIGPVGKFIAVKNCVNPYQVQFNAHNWKGEQRFRWEFGDYGTPDSTSKNPIHQYAARGNYRAKITLINDSNGCVYEHDELINIYDIKASIYTMDTIICSPADVTFSALGSQDAHILTYGFLGKDTVINNYLTRYTVKNRGRYTMRLIAADEDGCTDTAYTYVHAFKPVANFVLDTAEGCAPLTIHFSDSSISDTIITQYRWYPKAGQSSTNKNDSVYYGRRGFYTIELQVQDAVGCRDTIRKVAAVEVHQPEVVVSPTSQICAGDTVFFSNLKDETTYTYSWDFGFVTSNQRVQNVIYPSGGKYNYSVTVTDQYGCTDTVSALQAIDVQDYPNAELMSDIVDTNCYPAFVNFEDISNDTNIIVRKWNFGAGDPPVVVNGNIASYIFNFPGKFDISLYVETSYGCADSVLKAGHINIGGPYAEYNLVEDTGCVGTPFAVGLDSNYNVYQTFWDFGDGTVDTIFADFSQQHFYNDTGLFLVRVIYTDSSGKCVRSIDDTVDVFQVHSEFTLSEEEGCVPFTPIIDNLSWGGSTYLWDVTNFNISPAFEPSYTFSMAGDYDIVLVGYDSISGCTDTSEIKFVAHPLPEIEILDDTVICLGDTAKLWATGASFYEWQGGHNVSSRSTALSQTWPLYNSEYILHAHSDKGCLKKDSVMVRVQGPVSYDVIGDTTIYQGQEAPLNILTNDAVRVSWSPNFDIDCEGCLDPMASPLQTTTYTATVSDPFSCFSSSKNVKVIVNLDYYMHVPNAFTPNDDGLNDELYIVALGVKQLNFFRIFDRWGKLVFETDSFDEKWDGRIGGRIPHSQTYVYEIEAERYNGNLVHLVGPVSLIR